MEFVAGSAGWAYACVHEELTAQDEQHGNIAYLQGRLDGRYDEHRGQIDLIGDNLGISFDFAVDRADLVFLPVDSALFEVVFVRMAEFASAHTIC